MPTMKFLKPALILFCVSALMTGCDRDKQTDGVRTIDTGSYTEVPPNPLHELYLSVDDKLEAGDQAAATEQILAALDDPRYAEHKADLYTTVVRFLLFTEQLSEAKTRFLNIIRTEPELAMPGFDLIYGYYVRKGDAAQTLEWVRELLAQPLGTEMKRTANGWLMVALLEAGDSDELLAKLSEYVREYTAGEGAKMAQRLLSITLGGANYDLADKLLGVLRASDKAADAPLANALMVGDFRVLMGRGQWRQASERLPGAVAALPDATLQALLANITSAARQADKLAQLDSMVEVILRQAGEKKPGARRIAAREWVGLAVDQEKLAAVPERIGELITLKMSPELVRQIFERNFYKTLDSAAVVKAMLVQADALAPLLEDDSSRNALDGLVLDGAFVVEDFDRAITMLEKGVPDRNEEWHRMALSKVRAHKAIKEGQTDEAVKQLRVFMAVVAEGEEATPDPVTKVMHTKQMILGRNAKRIGDVYRDAGRAAEASKAYAEARELYNQALADDKAGKQTELLIREELAAIPAE